MADATLERVVHDGYKINIESIDSFRDISIWIGQASKRVKRSGSVHAGPAALPYRYIQEDNNRKIVDHIAGINPTYSDREREYLIIEGLLADMVVEARSQIF